MPRLHCQRFWFRFGVKPQNLHFYQILQRFWDASASPKHWETHLINFCPRLPWIKSIKTGTLKLIPKVTQENSPQLIHIPFDIYILSLVSLIFLVYNMIRTSWRMKSKHSGWAKGRCLHSKKKKSEVAIKANIAIIQ